MATYLLILFVLISSTGILEQAVDATRILVFKLEAKCNNFNSPATIEGMSPAPTPTQKCTVHHITQPGTFIHHVHPRAAGPYGSIRSLRFEIPNGAPPPVSIGKQAPIKAIIVMVILVLISSVATAVIRIICTRGQNLSPERPNRDESEPRPIGEGGQHFELTCCCKCDNFSLFTTPV